MSDKSLGLLIFIGGLVGAIVYSYWLFAPASPGDVLFYCPWINMRWAVVLPIAVAVLAVLVIAMWIGWTMFATPPPAVMEEASEPKPEEQKKGV
ncbi:MAG: hypothetical protein V1915_04135 [Candidatus Bathyarchaeota archaeon]